MYKEPLDILHRLSKAVARATDIEKIYQLILDEITKVMDVERASIMRFDPKEQQLHVVAAKGMERAVWKDIRIGVGEGVSGRVWKEGKPLLIKNVKGGSPRYKTHSYMVAPLTCFPMRVGEMPVGLINLTDKRSGKPFSNADLKLLTTLSDQVASYMHLYDLIGRLKTAEQDRVQLEMAKEIQQRLLPKQAPKIKGVEMTGCLIPAAKVGADYYDFIPNGKGLSLCIADVSGHNVAGAMLAFAFRSCLKAEIGRGRSPARVVEETNKVLYSDLFRSEQFISLFFAHFDPEHKKLSFTNAGHNPPLLLKKGTDEPEWLFTQDSLLGIEPSLSFHEKSTSLCKGDTLFLYTDGLTEAMNAKGERFSTERLILALRKESQKNASEILQGLLSRWKKFMEKHPPQDDVTLVVLKGV